MPSLCACLGVQSRDDRCETNPSTILRTHLGLGGPHWQFSFGVRMMCSKCGSLQLSSFTGQLCLRRGGLRNLTDTHLLYPNVTICLDCGFGEFGVQGLDLERLRMARLAGAA